MPDSGSIGVGTVNHVSVMDHQVTWSHPNDDLSGSVFLSIVCNPLREADDVGGVVGAYALQVGAGNVSQRAILIVHEVKGQPECGYVGGPHAKVKVRVIR